MLITLAVAFFSFVAVALLVLFFSRGLEKRMDLLLAETERDLDVLYAEIEAERVVTYTLAGIMTMAALGLILTVNILVAAGFGVIGYFLPRWYLSWQRGRRLSAFDDALPDAVSIMSNGLKAGRSLPQALDLVAKEMKPPISQEFSLLMRETQLGVDIDDALRRMGRRVGSRELDLVVDAAALAMGTGGNLAEVFDRIAHTIRDRFQMQGKIRALTAEGKMQAIFVGGLPIILLFVLLLIQPELMKPMLTEPIGMLILGGAFVLELIGIFAIRKMIDIDI